MTTKQLPSALIFAKDVPRLATLHVSVLEMTEVHSDASQVVLGTEAFQLVIYAMTATIAADIKISVPPEVREETPIKLCLGACRTLGVDSENRPQRGQFLLDLQPHSPAMRQKDGEKRTAAVDSQPTLPKPDRLLAVTSLAVARQQARALGGGMGPPARGWTARNFRACAGFDPEGHVFQAREWAAG